MLSLIYASMAVFVLGIIAAFWVSIQLLRTAPNRATHLFIVAFMLSLAFMAFNTAEAFKELL